MITRRQLAPALIGLTVKAERRIQGGFVFESEDRGHRIRDRVRFASPKQKQRIPVVVIGGGMAGLSAAWWMDRNGFRDFVVLEMEPQAGGNSRWGENDISAFPWAAHYVPVPGEDAHLVRELFTELGLYRDGEWNERWLCHTPQERLFLHGRWQDGIEPHVGMKRDDIADFDRFFARIREFRASGRFTIPMDTGVSRATPAERALDQLTMGEWMRREGLTSPYLRWLVDYSCRDDYGTSVDAVNAWVGVHYFASRPADDKGPLTWPEGNGWILRRLMTKLGGSVRNNSMVFRCEQQGQRWRVLTENCEYECDAVIWAAPSFLAQWVVAPAPVRWPLDSSPWLVANLTLDRWPQEPQGGEPAWDNVIYDSPGLGYVVATHQNVRQHQPKTVWTYYRALSEGNATDQRRVLLGGDWSWWSEKIFADLERAHPDIRACVQRLDIFRIGHAMPRPVPGSIFHPERLRRTKPTGSFVYANSDLSGLSLFEEAQYRGVTAARHVLSWVGGARKASSTGTR